MHYFTDVLKKYAVFEGRSSRKEYWMFILFYFASNILLRIIVIFSGFPITITSTIATTYSLGTLLPALGVTVRRLHDTGKSGWWILLGPISIIFLFLAMISFFFHRENILLIFLFLALSTIIWIISIILLSFKSQSGENKYGPNPNSSDISKITGVNQTNTEPLNPTSL